MVNKKTIKYFSIFCLTSLLLLTGCTKDNKDIDDNTKTNTTINEDEKMLNELQEDINNGENLSLTGNVLGNNDDEIRYNLRLRILATHYTHTNLLINIFPKPNKELLTNNVVAFTNEIQGYKEEAMVIKGILHDYEEQGFDVQFTEEEKFMNDNLESILNGSIQLLTDISQMFKVEGEGVYFDTENYTLEDYKEKYDNYHALIDETYKTYALYGSNFLIRKESNLKITEEMFDKLVLYKRHLMTDNELMIMQANLLIENKYKHGESVSLIKDYTHALLKKTINKRINRF